MFDMLSHGPGTLDYQIQVDKAGRYKLRFRVFGPAGVIQVLQNDQGAHDRESRGLEGVAKCRHYRQTGSRTPSDSRPHQRPNP